MFQQLVNGNSDPISGTNTSTIQKSKFGYGIPTVVPSDLLFTESKLGVPVTRGPIKRRAQQTEYNSLGNNEIIFQFPNDSLYDARRGYLTFDLAINTVGGTYKRIAEGIWSVFYRIRTKLGFELENMFEYNRYYSIIWDALNDARQSSAVARKLMGIGTPTERNILGASTSHYVMPLLSGFFDQDMLPLNLINNIAELFLNLGDAATYVETDGASPTITITNLRFHMEKISAANEYLQRVRAAMGSSGLTLGYNTVNYYSQNLNAGASSIQSIIINHKSASLKGFISVFTQSNQVANPLINDKFRTWLKFTDRHQLRLNERLFPEEPVEYGDVLSAEAYMTYLNWAKKWNLSGNLRFEPPPITVEEFSADKFLLIVDVNGYPYDDDVINPVGNDNVSIQMQLDINIPLPLPANFRFDTFVSYFRQIKINANGTVDVTF